MSVDKTDDKQRQPDRPDTSLESALVPAPLLLVVDDREENLEAMQALLGNDINWQLHCATSGEEALRYLLHNDVSLVLLDVQMPGIDGYEVAELMRANPNTRHTPIIFVSAIAHTQDSILRGYDNGAVDFILKPFNPMILRQKIYNLLSYENNRRALQRLNQRLERERALSQSILTNAAEGIMVVGQDGMIQYANPAMAEMAGIGMETLQNMHLLTLFDASDTEEMPAAEKSKNLMVQWQQSPFYHHWRHNKTYRLHEIHLQQTKGEPLPVAVSCAPLPQPQKAMVILVRDMATEQNLRQRLEGLIITDPLTGLLNRRGFYQAVESALARAKRSGHQLAILYLDLDGFKKINDSLGHDVGDDLLRHVATQLKSGIRSYDSLARLGGDEFTILLDALENSRDAAQVAEKMMKLIAQPYQAEGKELKISASVGIACYPDAGEDVEALLRAADMAMYEVKKNGRQQYHFHNPQMTARAHARLELEQRLRQAIDYQYFELLYQPQYYLTTGQLRGFEALLRWPQGNPDKMPPDQFIASLEETRLINPLGQWILNEGIARLKDINRQFGHEVMLSLNVSPVQFLQQQWVDKLGQQLRERSLPAHQLELEVTESVLMQNLDMTQLHLRDLHALGVSIAVDDFGTGYSSLAYLRQFELDVLKIDRLFITSMLSSPRDAAVVNTILDLSRHLGLQVIAEGVETQAQRQWLLHHNCNIMQGWLVAPALSFDAALHVPVRLDWSAPKLNTG